MAETVSGKVIKVTNDMLYLQTEDGKRVTMKVSDDTTYREKKMHKRSKRNINTDGYFEPMTEKGDRVEVNYTPNNKSMENAAVSHIIVIDD